MTDSTEDKRTTEADAQRRNKRVVRQIREELNLTKDIATDEEILKNTKGSLIRVRIEMGIELEKIEKEIKSAFKEHLYPMMWIGEKFNKHPAITILSAVIIGTGIAFLIVELSA